MEAAEAAHEAVEVATAAGTAEEVPEVRPDRLRRVPPLITIAVDDWERLIDWYASSSLSSYSFSRRSPFIFVLN